MQRLGWGERTVELDPGPLRGRAPARRRRRSRHNAWPVDIGPRGRRGAERLFGAGRWRRVWASRFPRIPSRFAATRRAAGLECTPFLATSVSGQDVSVFDNGLRLERTEWIDGGRLARLQYHRAAAKRSGVAPAAFADNLILELPGASDTLEDLVSRTDRGLLLTCLWYIREVDPATLAPHGSDTRRGLPGRARRDRRLRSTTSASTRAPSTCLLRPSRLAGASGRSRGSGTSGSTARRCPPLRVAEFNMSSVSPAT